MLREAIRQAARKSGLAKRLTNHTFRQSFATHLLADGYDILSHPVNSAHVLPVLAQSHHSVTVRLIRIASTNLSIVP